MATAVGRAHRQHQTDKQGKAPHAVDLRRLIKGSVKVFHVLHHEEGAEGGKQIGPNHRPTPAQQPQSLEGQVLGHHCGLERQQDHQDIEPEQGKPALETEPGKAIGRRQAQRHIEQKDQGRVEKGIPEPLKKPGRLQQQLAVLRQAPPAFHP